MTSPSTTRQVFLIGFMGAGKTSVGKALAQRLGWKFYDLDEVIEARERMTIAEIFAAAGETAFRKMESAALLELLEQQLAEEQAIVALGGGTFVQAGNREMLQRAGALTVLLDAPLEELERRCTAAPETRPLAQDRAAFHKLLASRRQAYNLAQQRVETGGKDIEQVAREIEQLLKNGVT